MFVAALLGRGDGDKLHLVELVLAQHAARIASGRAGLGAEAGRERGEAEGKLFLGEDGFADEIGERNFGGGNEPETFLDSFELSILRVPR